MKQHTFTDFSVHTGVEGHDDKQPTDRQGETSEIEKYFGLFETFCTVLCVLSSSEFQKK